jgi:hypothetical protein
MSWALAGLTTGGALGRGVAFFAGGVIFLGGAGLAEILGSATSAAGAGVAAAAVDGAGAAAGTAPEASRDARRRRATGASTVLDADLTYSPIS